MLSGLSGNVPSPLQQFYLVFCEKTIRSRPVFTDHPHVQVQAIAPFGEWNNRSFWIAFVNEHHDWVRANDRSRYTLTENANLVPLVKLHVMRICVK